MKYADMRGPSIGLTIALFLLSVAIVALTILVFVGIEI